MEIQNQQQLTSRELVFAIFTCPCLILMLIQWLEIVFICVLILIFLIVLYDQYLFLQSKITDLTLLNESTFYSNTDLTNKSANDEARISQLIGEIATLESTRVSEKANFDRGLFRLVEAFIRFTQNASLADQKLADSDKTVVQLRSKIDNLKTQKAGLSDKLNTSSAEHIFTIDKIRGEYRTKMQTLRTEINVLKNEKTKLLDSISATAATAANDRIEFGKTIQKLQEEINGLKEEKAATDRAEDEKQLLQQQKLEKSILFTRNYKTYGSVDDVLKELMKERENLPNYDVLENLYQVAAERALPLIDWEVNYLNRSRVDVDMDFHGLRKPDTLKLIEILIKRASMIGIEWIKVDAGKGKHSDKKVGAVLGPALRDYFKTAPIKSYSEDKEQERPGSTRTKAQAQDEERLEASGIFTVYI